MIRPINSSKVPLLQYKTGAAVRKGQLLKLDTGVAIPATEGVASAILLGVAAENAASGATVYMYSLDQLFEFDMYQGGATDVATAAMIGTAYDIYVDGAAGDGSAEGEMYIDFNDTTGAFVILVGYDNNRRVATGKFLEGVRYI